MMHTSRPGAMECPLDDDVRDALERLGPHSRETGTRCDRAGCDQAEVTLDELGGGGRGGNGGADPLKKFRLCSACRAVKYCSSECKGCC